MIRTSRYFASAILLSAGLLACSDDTSTNPDAKVSSDVGISDTRQVQEAGAADLGEADQATEAAVSDSANQGADATVVSDYFKAELQFATNNVTLDGVPTTKKTTSIFTCSIANNGYKVALSFNPATRPTVGEHTLSGGNSAVKLTVGWPRTNGSHEVRVSGKLTVSESAPKLLVGTFGHITVPGDGTANEVKVVDKGEFRCSGEF